MIENYFFFYKMISQESEEILRWMKKWLKIIFSLQNDISRTRKGIEMNEKAF